MAEVSGVAAVGDPGRLAELVQAVMAGSVHDLRVAAGLASDHARTERPTRRAAGIAGVGDYPGSGPGHCLNRPDARCGRHRPPERVRNSRYPCWLGRHVQQLSGVDVVSPVNRFAVASTALATLPGRGTA